MTKGQEIEILNSHAGDGNGECMELARSDFERLDAAMDALDELPDDQPGYVMEPPAKAAWALRNLNAVRGAEHDQAA